MARATTKKDLLIATEENYQELLELIDSLTPEQQEMNFLFEDRDKNVRDVLAHVYEWQEMMRIWYEVGMSGEKPEMPAPGYTWKTTAALNAVIWEKYQDTTLETIRTMLAESHQSIVDLIEKHTNEELYQAKYYKWTNTTTLGAYFVSSGPSHYDWAMKKIKKQRRLLKQVQK